MAMATNNGGSKKPKYTSPDMARSGATGSKGSPKKTAKKATAKKATVPSARRTGDMPAAKKTVVSQAVINQIKKDGMTAALKKSAGAASAAYKEGVNRMYGTTRAAKALAATIMTTPDAARRAASFGATTMPRVRSTSPDKARAASFGATTMPRVRATGPDMARAAANMPRFKSSDAARIAAMKRTGR
jgi:hypothetical protein